MSEQNILELLRQRHAYFAGTYNYDFHTVFLFFLHLRKNTAYNIPY